MAARHFMRYVVHDRREENGRHIELTPISSISVLALHANYIDFKQGAVIKHLLIDQMPSMWLQI